VARRFFAGVVARAKAANRVEKIFEWITRRSAAEARPVTAGCNGPSSAPYSLRLSALKPSHHATRDLLTY